MKSNKKAIIAPIGTSIRFSVLQSTEDMEVDEGNSHKDQTPIMQRADKNIVKKLPPLVLHGNVNEHQKFVALIKDIVANKFHVKYHGDTVSIFLNNLSDYESLKKTWQEKGMSFHTYTRKEEKKRVYVINGLHSETTTE